MSNLTNILEFGIKRENEERRDGGCAVVFDPESQKYAVGKSNINTNLRLFGGGLNENESMKEGVLREIVEESGLHDYLYVEEIDRVFAHYFNNSKKVSRCAEATCFLIVLNSTKLRPTKLEEHEKFSLAWVNPKEAIKNWESRNENKDYDHWIYFLRKSVNRAIELGHDTTNQKL
jgi:8-oxo-dGTP pyrophosphatase MutT (NUDIX family)